MSTEISRFKESTKWMWRLILATFVIVIAALAAEWRLIERVNDDSDKAKRTAQTANETSSKVAILFTQGEDLAHQIVLKARFNCRGINQLREFQGQALELSILQTEKSLHTKGGLGELESFRPLIERQQRERKLQLRRLRAYTAQFPVKRHPYRVDCSRAHRLP